MFKDLGLKKTTAHRWQRLAEATLDRLERTLKQLREAEHDLTTAAVLRALRPEPLPPIDDPDRWEMVLGDVLCRTYRMCGDRAKFVRRGRYYLEQIEKGKMS
jgi:hypothetical protein